MGSTRQRSREPASPCARQTHDPAIRTNRIVSTVAEPGRIRRYDSEHDRFETALPSGRRATAMGTGTCGSAAMNHHIHSRHAQLIARLLANPGEVDSLSDDEVVLELLASRSVPAV